jgi:hypothetical protein
MPNTSQLRQQGFFMLQGPIESKKPEQDELPTVASATVPTSYNSRLGSCPNGRFWKAYSASFDHIV